VIELESAVARWRSTLARFGVRSRDDLDELEDHLRSLVEANLADGQDLKQALDTAIGRFGRLEDLTSDWVAAPSSPLPPRWKALARRWISITRRISAPSPSTAWRAALPSVATVFSGDGASCVSGLS
jgi:hypothetical protein